MTNKIWVSPSRSDTTLFTHMGVDRAREDMKKMNVAFDAHAKGQWVSPELLPKAFYGLYRDASLKLPPDVFAADGFLCVSAACAEVISKFNLGKSTFVPFEIFQNDQKTRLAGEYFIINFGESKTCFSLSQTQSGIYRLAKNNPGYGFLEDETKLRVDVEDFDVAANVTALEGCDLWIDPTLYKSVFASDQLVQALKAAKFSKRFRFKQCRIV